jgi:fumarate hydratase, class II
MSATRTERDSFGPIEVPAERLWGAQTQRSLQYFAVSTETMPPELVHALVRVKRAAAIVNRELGLLDAAKAQAIAAAADEVLAGTPRDEFPLSVWQTGSGTQTNMNVNEVLANRASELLGGARQRRAWCTRTTTSTAASRPTTSFRPRCTWPRRSHSSAAAPALRALRARCTARPGLRRHRQDRPHAPAGRHAADAGPGVLRLRGATRSLRARGHRCDAAGGARTGDRRHRGRHRAEHAPAVRRARGRELAADTGLPFVPRPNKFAALAGHEPLLALHGALKTLAAALNKIANDVRWLASGPRAGIGEITIPENEPGSSIMPGKVNPTQCEMLTMVAPRWLATTWRSTSARQRQLRAERVQAADRAQRAAERCGCWPTACASFDAPLRARHRAAARAHRRTAGRSLMLVTALAPHIGYDQAAAIAKKAHHDGH